MRIYTDVSFPISRTRYELPACTDGPFRGRSHCSPGSSSAPPAAAAGCCCWQQRLLKGDEINSVVVAEIVPLRSYHPGKHSWKRFKQTRAHKAEQNIRAKAAAIRKTRQCLVSPWTQSLQRCPLLLSPTEEGWPDCRPDQQRAWAREKAWLQAVTDSS